MLWKEKSGPPGIFSVSELCQDLACPPTVSAVKHDWQICPGSAVVLLKAGPVLWMQDLRCLLNCFKVISPWYWWIWIWWAIVRCQQRVTFLSDEVFAQHTHGGVMTGQSSVWQAKDLMRRLLPIYQPLKAISHTGLYFKLYSQNWPVFNLSKGCLRVKVKICIIM